MSFDSTTVHFMFSNKYQVNCTTILGYKWMQREIERHSNLAEGKEIMETNELKVIMERPDDHDNLFQKLFNKADDEP